MIYESPSADVPLSQGDMIDDCTVLAWKPFQTGSTESTAGEYSVRVVVITQACDLAQTKSERVLVAVVHDAQSLVDQGVLKATLIRDQIRMHRVYGWFFLPAGDGVPKSVVDLRDLHTVPRTMLEELIAGGKRLSRIVTPYREHLAQHFATTYSRIALPEPYETQVP